MTVQVCVVVKGDRGVVVVLKQTYNRKLTHCVRQVTEHIESKTAVGD